MLYDRRWERKLDVDSLDSLIAWLETMPADEVYLYTDTGQGTTGCLLCQYYRAMGLPVWAMEKNHRRPHQGERVPLPEHFNEIAMGGLNRVFGRHYIAFGDALAVAKALKEETK